VACAPPAELLYHECLVPSESLMARAIALAVENVRAGRGGPFAALVVRGGDVLAEGTNIVTTSNDPTAHAEIVAIRGACRKLGHFQLAGCELYTSCEPCPMCMGAIYWARPSRVWFAATRQDAAAIGFDDSFIYDQLSLAPSDRALPMQSILREQALAAFEAWRQKPDKAAY
jgi:tRNA(Arg) A34 adenosine deaminase TadA